MNLFDQIETSIAEADALDAQRRRDERLSLCMKMAFIKELPNGGKKITHWRCKDPRCEFCNTYKGEQYKERILSVMRAGHKVYQVYLFKQAAEALCKRIRKENYLRLPQGEDLFVVFFITPGKNSKAEELTVTDINEFDWTQAVSRKSSCKISGALGKEKEEEEKVSEYVVDVEDIIAGPYENAVDAVRSTSMAVIAWQEPEDVDENQRFRNVYNAELYKRLKLAGCRIFGSISRKMYIDDFKVSFFMIEEEK